MFIRKEFDRRIKQMNKTKEIHYKSILADYLRDLQMTAGKAAVEMKKEGKMFSDPLDQAAAELDMDVELLISSRNYALIREIREAISRIDRGMFGICESCGEPITEKRLRANPMSRLCLQCQTREERVRRQKTAIGRLAYA